MKARNASSRIKRVSMGLVIVLLFAFVWNYYQSVRSNEVWESYSYGTFMNKIIDAGYKLGFRNTPSQGLQSAAADTGAAAMCLQEIMLFQDRRPNELEMESAATDGYQYTPHIKVDETYIAYVASIFGQPNAEYTPGDVGYARTFILKLTSSFMKGNEKQSNSAIVSFVYSQIPAPDLENSAINPLCGIQKG